MGGEKVLMLRLLLVAANRDCWATFGVDTKAEVEEGGGGGKVIDLTV